MLTHGKLQRKSTMKTIKCIDFPKNNTQEIKEIFTGTSRRKNEEQVKERTSVEKKFKTKDT